MWKLEPEKSYQRPEAPPPPDLPPPKLLDSPEFEPLDDDAPLPPLASQPWLPALLPVPRSV